MKPYAIFLHVSLVALAVLCLLLVHENHQLQQQLSPQVAQLEAGETVEPVAVTSLAGDSRVLDWQSTEKDRLLLVFTTSCPACKENQAAWRSLHEELSPDLEIVGISLDSAESTLTYRNDMDLPFEVVVATDREAFASAYEISAVPMTLHVDGDGQVLGAWRGGLTPEQIEQVEDGAARSIEKS